MNRKERKIIKRLAKESLNEKWYPIQKGLSSDRAGNCAFCDDLEQRRFKTPRKTDDDYCSICYLDIIEPHYCNNIGEKSIVEVIRFLQHLKRYGRVKKSFF